MKKILFSLLLLTAMSASYSVSAQDIQRKNSAQLMQEYQAADIAENITRDPFEDQSNSVSDKQFEKIKNEFYYVVILCVVCLLSLIIILINLRSCEHSPGAKEIINASGLTLIIFGTIILVLVVNTSEQLTAAIGILGAIAGYLFRSVQENPKELNHHNESTQPKE